MLVPQAQKTDTQLKQQAAQKVGLVAKPHALTDALGYPPRFIPAPGQAADISQAGQRVHGLSVKKRMADKGYDPKGFVAYLDRQHIEAIIPSRANVVEPRERGWHTY